MNRIVTKVLLLLTRFLSLQGLKAPLGVCHKTGLCG